MVGRRDVGLEGVEIQPTESPLGTGLGNFSSSYDLNLGVLMVL